MPTGGRASVTQNIRKVVALYPVRGKKDLLANPFKGVENCYLRFQLARIALAALRKRCIRSSSLIEAPLRWIARHVAQLQANCHATDVLVSKAMRNGPFEN